MAVQQACGIIAEYNPFHRGHAYQLQQARQKSGAACLIVAMSGNYVQRGEPAIIDKWQRARLALAHGADIVVELPFAVSCQPADRFATGALAILAALGCDTLAFGTETPTFDYQDFVQRVWPQSQQQRFAVDYTKTYATQWNELLQQEMGSMVAAPNQLLALSYAIANAQLAQPLTLLPLARVGVDHDQDSSGHDQHGQAFASASYLRRQLLQGQTAAISPFVPYGPQVLQGPFLAADQLWPWLHYRLTTTWPQALAPIYQMSEGLEYRFWEQNLQSQNWSDFLRRVKSKRYTYARLRRLALYTLLNVTAAEIQQALTQQPQLRLLGFTAAGQQYLHQQRSKIAAPLITRVTAAAGAPQGPLGLQIRVDRLYEQLTGREQNFKQQIIIKK
ncbi:nucleotidyltransferase [Lapidilactobacillus achengensis]|uniref:tRNA(Met) cytidine acetate ligase n=1 Tax=Lapidilactobacillus achengensis TaxID=2486000 RepID=A0ABW1UNE7_9LACO|nr:nucleotidyltransferase [Lapidilactobacillus achengensis]